MKAGQAVHILPLWLYVGVFGALLALTGVTVAVSYFDFGAWNMVVALAVAGLKASLVAAVFMHLAFDARLHSVVLLVAVLFVAALLLLTLADTGTRAIADPLEGERTRNVEAPFEKGVPL